MARKCLLGLIALLFITYNAYGQLNTEVIVTLKGGREIKGTITEEIPGESITIKTTDGDVFIYRNSEIAKIYNPNLTAQKIAEKQRIEREKAEKKAEAKEARNALRQELKLGNFKGYRGIIDVGYNICVSHRYSTNHRITASFINGINVGPYFYIGLGVGIESGIYHVNNGIYNYYDFIENEDLTNGLHIKIIDLYEGFVCNYENIIVYSSKELFNAKKIIGRYVLKNIVFCSQIIIRLFLFS